MKKNNVQFITRTAVIAAVYVVITVMFAGLSYGQIQFRISEILILFAFIDPLYIPGLTIGCALANLGSPLGIIDVVVGSIATLVALLYIVLIRKKLGNSFKSLVIASLGPVIFNGLIVGWELNYLFQLPYIITVLYVAAGEFLVVTICGTIILRKILNNEKLVEKLKITH